MVYIGISINFYVKLIEIRSKWRVNWWLLMILINRYRDWIRIRVVFEVGYYSTFLCLGPGYYSRSGIIWGRLLIAEIRYLDICMFNWKCFCFRFVENPVTCKVTHVSIKQGKSQCLWSSCREGTKKYFFQITHVLSFWVST